MKYTKIKKYLKEKVPCIWCNKLTTNAIVSVLGLPQEPKEDYKFLPIPPFYLIFSRNLLIHYNKKYITVNQFYYNDNYTNTKKRFNPYYGNSICSFKCFNIIKKEIGEDAELYYELLAESNIPNVLNRTLDYWLNK